MHPRSTATAKPSAREFGAQNDATFTTGHEASDDFLRACHGGDVFSAFGALFRGADVGACGPDGINFAHLSAMRGDVKLLNGVLSYVLRDVQTIARLVDSTTTEKQHTPLHLACFERSAGSAAVVARLLELGARIDARDANGFTPLLLAAIHENVAVVDALLSDTQCIGDVIEARENVFGDTALFYACKTGNVPIATSLLDKGHADVCVRGNTFEYTTLTLAITKSPNDALALLILAHAAKTLSHEKLCEFVNEPTPAGRSPVEAARDRGYVDLACRLVLAGAREHHA